PQQAFRVLHPRLVGTNARKSHVVLYRVEEKKKRFLRHELCNCVGHGSKVVFVTEIDSGEMLDDPFEPRSVVRRGTVAGGGRLKPPQVVVELSVARQGEPGRAAVVYLRAGGLGRR